MLGRAKKRAVFVVSVLLMAVGCSKPKESKPVYHEDLRPFGFLTAQADQSVGSFTDVNFLTDDLVSVTINNRVYGSVEPLFADQPPSKLLLFDVAQRTLLRTAEVSIEKAPGSVRATRGGNFVLLNESGLNLCSPELQCKLALATRGPIFVSPGGTRVAVGGNSRTEQKLLDGVSLNEIERFPWLTQVIPGDAGLLVRKADKLYVRLPQQTDQLLRSGGVGAFPEARFLNGNTIADFSSDKRLVIAKTDGTVLFSVPVSTRWHAADIVTSEFGLQFCFHEAGYTTFNSILNFYDIDSNRTFNFESVQVITTDRGESLFNLRWDPRPSVGLLPRPALSPDGHRLAIIRNGFLDVFYIQ